MENLKNHHKHLNIGTKTSLIGIISNFLLFLMKIIIGLASGNITTTIDAINNLSDSGTSVMALISFKTAKKPADNKHPYGYARFEYIGALLISILIFTIGVFLLNTSIQKLINPKDFEISLLLYIILSLSILVKIGLLIYFTKANKKLKTLTLKSLITDCKYDSIASFLVLLSVMIFDIFNVNLDGIFGIILSLMIIISSIKLIIETVSPLIGEKAQEQFIADIKSKLNKFDIVLGVHDIMVHSYGKSNNFVVAHVLVNAELNLMDIYDEISQVERTFLEKHNIHLTLHIDPVQINDTQEKELKIKVKNLINKSYPDLTLTTLRIVHEKYDDIVIIELVVPFKYKIKKSTIQAFLSKNIENKKKKYEFIIDFDKPYTSPKYNSKKIN